MRPPKALCALFAPAILTLGDMDYFREINDHEYLELLEIGETDEWALRLVLAEAIVSEIYGLASKTEEPNDSIRELINSSKPIGLTKESKLYEILFDDYITYSVINESYISGSDNEEYTGDLARIYSKSDFLDYVQKVTFATQEFPGPFKHYGFCCGNHVVDVASVEEPKIRMINVT